MESINLFSAPEFELKTQARTRKRALIGIILTWFIIMCGLIASAATLDHQQQTRIAQLQHEIETLEPQLQEIQTQDQAYQQYLHHQCLARELQSMFSHPSPGIHITWVKYDELWSMEGWASHSRALDEYKVLIEPHFESTEWIEQTHDLKLHFEMQGSLLC